MHYTIVEKFTLSWTTFKNSLPPVDTPILVRRPDESFYDARWFKLSPNGKILYARNVSQGIYPDKRLRYVKHWLWAQVPETYPRVIWAK